MSQCHCTVIQLFIGHWMYSNIYMKKIIIFTITFLLFFTNMVYATRIGKPRRLTDFDINNLTVLNDTLEELWNITNGRYNEVDGYFKIGDGDLYLPFYQDDGDLYSEDGKAYFGGGMNAVAERYGVGLQIRERSLIKTLLYDIDATFTVATATVEKAGQTFVTDGVEIDDFLIVTDANDTSYIGSCGEIIAVTETTIVVSMASAGDNVPDDLTEFDFVVYNHPLVSILDNGDVHFTVGVSSDASFKIHIDEGNNEHGVHIVDVAGVDGHAAMEIEMDANSNSGISVIKTGLDATGFDEIDDSGTILDVVIDNTGRTGDIGQWGEIHAMDVAIAETTASGIIVSAVATGPGVEVIHQHLGDPVSLDKGYEYDGAFQDRTTELDSAASNVQIFDSDNHYILVASAAVFDNINIIMITEASHTITPVFEYVDDDGNWTAFSPADDTNGFQQNGAIRYDSDTLVNWGQRTETEITGAGGSTDYYWIRITRTRNVLPTSPLKVQFK